MSELTEKAKESASSAVEYTKEVASNVG